MGVNFFIRKKTIPGGGGGPRGGLAKDHKKYVFFSDPFPKGQLSNNQINSRLLVHKISELMRAKYICIMTHSSITQFIMLGWYQMSAEGKIVL